LRADPIMGLVPWWIRWRTLGARRLLRWARRNGWAPVHGRTTWPWLPTPRGTGTPVVLAAVAGTVDGYPVVVGDVRWSSRALVDVTGLSAGRGSFAVLRLPRVYPRIGVYAKFPSGRRKARAGTFPQSFAFPPGTSRKAYGLITGDLKRAHLEGRVPDWVLVRDELYIVVPRRGRLTPRRVRRMAGYVRRIADLLALTPTGPR